MIPKFRALNTKTGFWFDEQELVFCDGKWFQNWRSFEDDFPLNMRDCAVMQYTGLKDKNGVEIFEGDIVQWGDTPDWEEEPIRVAVVKINPDIQFDSNVGIFEYGRFIYQDTERFLTVLGNVYENSELLEANHD